jgi:TP901 family phage tail tape measure protein
LAWAFIDILPRFDNFAVGIQSKIGGLLSSVEAALGPVGTAIAGLGAVGAVVGGKLALSFEDAFVKIHALSNASSADIAQWKDQILSLATETAKSPQELANALFFLASAGLETSQVMQVLEASAKASAAGMGSVDALSRTAAEALNAFAKSGLTSTQIFDTLTAGIKASTAAPDEFAGALGRILPIAARAGVTFDQVVGSLAALSNIGLSVDEGVTAMRGLLQALVAPGTQAAKTLASVGISADQMRAAIADQGIVGALDLLEKATGGNLDILRKIIPNVRSLTGELGLEGQNADKAAKTINDVTHATGEANRAFAIAAKGPLFALRSLVSQAQVDLLKFGEAFLPLGGIVVATFTAILKVAEPIFTLMSKLKFEIAAVGSAFLIYKTLSFVPSLLESIALRLAAVAPAAATTKILGAGTALSNLASAAGTGELTLALVAIGAAFFAASQNASKMKTQIDDLVSTGNLAQMFVDIGVSGGTALQRMGQVGATLVVLKQKMDAAGLSGSAWTLALKSVDTALQHGDVSAKDALATYRSFGISLGDATARVNFFADSTTVHLNKAGRSVKNFANLTGDALKGFKSDVGSSMNFVESRFDSLGGKAKITAQKILHNLRDALREQQRFAERSTFFLAKVGDSLGPGMEKAAQEMVGALAQAGPEGAARVDALYQAVKSGNFKLVSDILATWKKGGTAADGYVTHLTKINDWLGQLDGRTVDITIVERWLRSSPGGGTFGGGGSGSGGGSGGGGQVGGPPVTAPVPGVGAPITQDAIRQAVADGVREGTRDASRHGRTLRGELRIDHRRGVASLTAEQQWAAATDGW